MKSIETEGKTIDQAIELGLYKLSDGNENRLTRDQVKIRILEEAGLFNKAKVRLTLNQTSEVEEQVSALANQLVEKMGLKLNVYAEETENGILIDLTGPDAAIAIGKHGDCLEAISTVLNNIYNKGKAHDELTRIIVDSNNYKSRREATLVSLAKKMASRAIREGKNVKLEPMTSYERRIIHNALTNETRVTSESEGSEPNRYVVIKLVNPSNKFKEKSEARKETNPLQEEVLEERADND
ncbi:MAG: KH domain-containing protein [bacterium]|nr:KH domain-containing protein [bacterium]